MFQVRIHNDRYLTDPSFFYDNVNEAKVKSINYPIQITYDNDGRFPILSKDTMTRLNSLHMQKLGMLLKKFFLVSELLLHLEAREKKQNDIQTICTMRKKLESREMLGVGSLLE